jgi:hypothetical protein
MRGEVGVPRGAAGKLVDPSFAAGEKALDYLRSKAVKDLRRGFVYVPDGTKVELGAAAQSLLALCERERALRAAGRTGRAAADRELMKGLAEFLLKQQTPRGEFRNTYDPARGTPGRERAAGGVPGEAILALLRLHRLQGGKDPRLLAACHRAAAQLIREQHRQAAANFRQNVKAALVYPPDPAFMRALEELIALGERPGYRKHLFALADRLCAGQLRTVGQALSDPGESTRYPDLVGAMHEAELPSVAATGERCRGLVSALRVALKGGGAERVGRYARALMAAARYVMQNQYHAHNAYALPAPEKAVGGFRRNPLACSLLIDGSGHCSVFLLEWAAQGAKVNVRPRGRR